MNISNKEKIMLCILGIILVGFGYYNFVYTPQLNSIKEKSSQQSEIEEKYNTTIATINSLEDKKIDSKILKAKITNGSSAFYPVISEEHIIIELDKLLEDNNLKGGITFEPIVSAQVESTEKENLNLAESSIQGIVDKYSSIDKDSKENEITTSNSTSQDTDSSQKSNKSNEIGNSNNSNAESTNQSEKKEKNTVHYLKCAVNFEGTYDGLNKFLNTIGKNEKKIVVNSITLSQESLGGIKGTVNLEIYAIPKIEDELQRYLKWNLNNTYGKTVPFNTGAATGSVNVEKDTTDFIASIKSINSDLPTIMIGKANDSLRNTYAYADSNSKENVEMVLTQDGDKYYYKYKTSMDNFPVNYDGLGAEFIPASKNIVISVLSESRVTSNDLSEIKLKITNKTDRLVNVDISGEDKSNPRVSIDGDGSNISVNQK